MRTILATLAMIMAMSSAAAQASDKAVVDAFRGRILTMPAGLDPNELVKGGPTNTIAKLKAAVVTTFPMQKDGAQESATIHYMAFFNKPSSSTTGSMVLDDVTGGKRVTIYTIELSGLAQGGYEVEGEFNVDSDLCFEGRRYEARIVVAGATLASGPFQVKGGRKRQPQPPVPKPKK